MTPFKLLLIGCLPVLAVFLQQSELLKHWDNQAFDAEVTLLSRPFNEEIVIIAIDEHSLKQQGKWPWSRRTHAELINRLTAAGAQAIGFDIIFAEPDKNDPDADQALVEAVKNNGRIILPVLPEKSNYDGVLKASLPWPELAKASAGLGHVDIEIDKDGIVRSAYLTAGVDGKHWPAFSLALAMLKNPNQANLLKGARILEPYIFSDSWQRDFRIEVPFADARDHFSQLSYADVLLDASLSAGLRGKTILVGMTATGLAQMFITPQHRTSGLMSGVEVNANILDVLTSDLSIQKLNKTWSLLLSCFLVFFPVVGYNFFPQRHALLISLLFSVLTTGISVALMKALHVWYSPVSVVLVLTVGYLLWHGQRLQFFSRLLFTERQFTKATLHSIADAVITTNREGLIVYMNPTAEKLTGFSLDTAQGLNVDSVVRFINSEDNLTQNQFNYSIHNLLSGLNIHETVPRFIVNNSGDEFAVQINGSPIQGETDKITGAVLAFTDITEIVQSNRKISHLATHDPLTGLSNRVLFNEQIKKAIASCHRQGNYLAVLFINLDDFKKINDGMGHAVGDLLLIEVASRLLANMRQNDTVARWGGDEFVVLLNQLPFEENITGIIVKILERLSRPYDFDGLTLYVTPSIGISVYPKDGLTPEILLAYADAAMFQVKENGRNNFSFFCSGFNKSAKQRLVMEKEMYCALEEGQFEVYYQPQIELTTNRITGAEALLRWNHPQKGFISPDTFIPLAEETGLINEIGDWVLQQVCRQLSNWQKQGVPAICVAVNLSPRQFLQESLCANIEQALNKYDMKGCLLKIEITESMMIKNVDKVAKMLWDIRALGVSISIDDFGTGYSSLSVLKNFPIDQLKIDKSFITHLDVNPDDANIAQSIIMLGHNMGMNVVAEGVENQIQLDSLLGWGCDVIQGFYFSPPLTSVGMAKLLKQSEFIKNGQAKDFRLN